MAEDRESGPRRGDEFLTGSAAGETGDCETPPASLPPSVRRRLHRCADQFIEQRAAEGSESPWHSARPPTRRGLPWALSVALLLVALTGWWPRLSNPGDIGLAGLAAQWSARVARERMLHSGPAVGRWSWRSDAAGTGDVVWDNDRQQGFLLLNGFVANDPAVTRYQLWIFDADRDERYPVDGGLFDVPAGQASVVVPIKPAVPVSRPSGFAVTVERPGGAVVSMREHVVALAPVDG